jgi:hypothetical protein
MADGGSGDADTATVVYQDVVKAVFSWVILMPIAVMVSGKLVGQTIKLSGQRGQLFQVKLPKVITIAARDDEVILGFTMFLIALMVSGLSAGAAIYRFMVADFGIDPGQFDALCVFSSFVVVAASVLLFLLSRGAARLRRRADPRFRRFENTIEKLAAEPPRDRSDAADDR